MANIDMQAAVREFHEAFNHPVGTLPNVMTPELVAKRLKWMREELDEFELWASRVGDPDWDQELVLAEMYDAMIDEIYFDLGTLVIMGLQVQPGFLIVHGANMAKLHDGPDGTKVAVYNEDGKVVKPEGWTAPDLREEVLKQDMDAKIEGMAQQMAALDENETFTIIDPVTPWAMERVMHRAAAIRGLRR